MKVTLLGVRNIFVYTEEKHLSFVHRKRYGLCSKCVLCCVILCSRSDVDGELRHMPNNEPSINLLHKISLMIVKAIIKSEQAHKFASISEKGREWTKSCFELYVERENGKEEVMGYLIEVSIVGLDRVIRSILR